MKAWIIKWNWIGDHAAVEKPLVNILSARTQEEDIRKYVERVYASHYYNVSEQLAFARYNKPDKPPYPAYFETIDGMAYPRHIICGHNPFVEAFLADGIIASDTPLGVSWDEASVRQAREKFRETISRLGRT